MRNMLGFIVKSLIVAFLFAVLFAYAMFQGGFVSWFLFYAFLPFLLYMAALLIYPVHDWKVERRLSKRMAVGGETIEVEVTLKRRLPFPIYYCVIEEHLPHSLKKVDKHLEKYKDMEETDHYYKPRKVKRVVFPWFNKAITYRYQLDQVPRGEHVLKTFRIKTGDFFSFVKKEHIYQHESKLLVFPYVRPVKMKDRVNSFEKGASPSFKWNEKNTNIVTGVREYMPGDRFAWVDWKTTAKKNEMMTKEFEQEKSVDMMLILNGVYHPDGSSLSFEGAVEFTASMLKEYHKYSSPLSFMSLGDERKYYPFRPDHTYQQKIQEHLARIRHTGKIPFAQQLDREKSLIPSGILLMIVSHYLDKDLQNEISKWMKRSKRIVFFYVCPHNQLSFQDHQAIKQLKSEGIVVNILSEDQLTQQQFEVNT
ncbi:Uncharacterized conserved protein, DUF58 family, contains vWF domain [Halobacillus karajensis]|uniref:DUF58 domain-containing protein n=1 Tax=Halobacillus karajensis TaxID=195088 RepID=UPI0008A7E1A2|nr:DUF58 domain-containing protein [Halobacillus karajensis]SEH88339.1 Uncharacterized conserved protein, DUF58 family, contains vWF domain [Halobacillus karajensis]